MYAGFNLKIDNTFFNKEKNMYEVLQEKGEEHLSSQKAKYEKDLESYITDKIINGTKVQSDWFPQVDADIFISHSHEDKDLANAFAGWLYTVFNLKCFIDSNVWGYADNLLEILNDKYSNKRTDEHDGGYLYSHQSCNKVSQHVNTMLNIALQKMIDKTEAIFLLNTSNSISISKTYDRIDETYSPWIYSELVCSEIVRKRPLSDYRIIKAVLEHAQFSFRNEAAQQIQIKYDAPTKHLIPLNESDLSIWWAQSANSLYKLDDLYKLKKIGGFSDGR